MSASGNNKAMGMVTVDVEENKSSVDLDGSVEISLEDKKVSVPVHQAGKSGRTLGRKWGLGILPDFGFYVVFRKRLAFGCCGLYNWR